MPHPPLIPYNELEELSKCQTKNMQGHETVKSATIKWSDDLGLKEFTRVHH